jgi:hypothetical protein
MSDTYQTRNYTAHGGRETVIGGELIIRGTLSVEEGATVSGLSANPLTAATASKLGGVKVGNGLSIAGGVLSVTNPLTPAANQAASEASDVEGLLADFNTLLAALKAAGIVAADGG